MKRNVGGEIVERGWKLFQSGKSVGRRGRFDWTVPRNPLINYAEEVSPRGVDHGEKRGSRGEKRDQTRTGGLPVAARLRF